MRVFEKVEVVEEEINDARRKTHDAGKAGMGEGESGRRGEVETRAICTPLCLEPCALSPVPCALRPEP